MGDLRYAVRSVVRQPVFAALVIGTLTVGIGAATSMFAVVDAVLLRPLPYGDPDRLVWMFGAFRASDTAAVSPPDFVDYRARNATFQALAAMAIAPESVTVSGIPIRLQASRVSARLMTTLGVAPILGRDFTAADEVTAGSAVILSHRLWRERFGQAAAALGQALVVDGRPRTIVGVMPAGFTLPYDSFIRLTEPVDLYVPLSLNEPDMQVRRFHSLRLIGRLAEGRSLEEAQSEMDVIAGQLAALYPENDTWRLRLLPLYERIVAGVRPILLILLGTVALLLVVACANVASLLLARGSTRAGELAVRGALGASRARLIRQLLIEGLSVSLAGSAGALLVAYWIITLLRRVGPAQFPRLETLSFEPRLLLFALAAAVATTLLFALAPALHAVRGGLVAAMQPSRGATQNRSRSIAQRALVVAELAVSIVLLAAAAVLVRSFIQLVSVEPGFQPANVLLMRLPLPEERYDTDTKVDGYYETLLARLVATPGIERAALATAPPLAGANDTMIYRAGQPPPSPREGRFAQIRWIMGDYFSALGIPHVAGRAFDPQLDRAGAPLVAIINQQMAREHFGGDGALGQSLAIDLGKPVIATIVGITGDVRVFGQAAEAPPLVYLHARQRPALYMQLVIKSAAPVEEVASIVRRHVLGLDPQMAVARIDRMETLVADSVAQPRFAMLLVGAFATVTLVLTLVGLYGTLAYLVARRRREIGIRVALGATARDVHRIILRQGARMIAFGVAIGLVASLFTARLAAAATVEFRTSGLLVPAIVALVAALVALTAVLVPARRAARLDALVALRDD
jgi:putative ABC transport system permease protein